MATPEMRGLYRLTDTRGDEWAVASERTATILVGRLYRRDDYTALRCIPAFSALPVLADYERYSCRPLDTPASAPGAQLDKAGGAPGGPGAVAAPPLALPAVLAARVHRAPHTALTAAVQPWRWTD